MLYDASWGGMGIWHRCAEFSEGVTVACCGVCWVASPSLLDEYAYALKEGGRLYTITDVPDLHTWMDNCCVQHMYFRRMTDEELVRRGDGVGGSSLGCFCSVTHHRVFVAVVMYTYTEEGKKVERNAGPKLASVFVRRSDAEALAVEATRDFWEPLSSVAAFRAGAPELAGVAGAGAGKA